jgi:hypothetical protein
MRHVLLLQAGVEGLVGAHEPILVAAGEPEEAKLLAGGGWI